MTLTVHRGDTFLITFSGNPNEHLYIVITEVEISTGNFVYVGIESFENKKAERSVELFPGDHDFISKKSCPVYRLADVMSVQDLEKKINDGLVIRKNPMNTDIVNKISNGLLTSNNTRNYVREFYQNLTWPI